MEKVSAYGFFTLEQVYVQYSIACSFQAHPFGLICHPLRYMVMTFKNLSFGSASSPTLLLVSFPTASNSASSTHPKINSGCEKKSVIRSSRLRGSNTKVGKAIFERSIPGLTTTVSR